MKDYNYYLDEVKKLGWTIRYVPRRLITPELCKIAVEQNGLALKYVP